MPAPSDLVHQTSTSTGTGNFTLVAVNGKRSFNTAFGNGATTEVFNYYISNRRAAEWERGTGHLSAASTLVRDRVLASSNANAAVSFTAGTKDVTNDIPALAQWRLNVKEYGATGDGSTDDAPAINRALTAAAAQGVGTVFLPSGTYRIASVPVLMVPGVCLLGEGNSSILKQGISANLGAVVDLSGFLGGTAAHYGSIRHCLVDANRANNTSQLNSGGSTYRAVYFGNTNFVTVDHCTIQNCPGYGVAGSGQRGLTISNNIFTNSEAHQIFVVETGGTSEGDCRIFNNTLDNLMLVGGISQVIIRDNIIEGTLIGDASTPMHVSVSGTAVTWVSGPDFTDVEVGMTLIADNGTVQTEIKTVNSTTSLTLAATMGTHTNKLAMIGTNDLLGVGGGITHCIIHGNIVRHGCSFGLSFFGGTMQFQNVIVSNNICYRQGKQGIVLLSDGTGGSTGAKNCQFLGNHVKNSCQGGLAGDLQVNLCSYVVTIQDIDTILMDNNFAEDDLSLTNCWLSVAGLTNKVILGQGNYQVGAQVDGVYQPSTASILQPVIATSVMIGDDVTDSTYKFQIKTSTNEDVEKLTGPSSNTTRGFFGSTAYWQNNGGAIELGTSTNHGVSLRTQTVKRLEVAGGGDVTIRGDVATPAGGSTSARLLLGTTSGFGIYYGSSTPSVSAAKGSIYLRSDGTQNNRMYINTDGGTTWTPFATTS